MVQSIAPGAAGAQHNFPYPLQGDTTHRATGTTTNSSAQLSLAPDAARGYVVGQVLWSYKGSTTPTGNLTIGDGTNNFLDLDINDNVPREITFNPPLLCAVNAPLVVTLGAGGAGVTGKVHARTWILT